MTFFGDGGSDGKGAGTVIDVSCCGCCGSVCRGCSVCVAVVGDEEFDSASEGALLDEAEKYAEVGVGVTVDEGMGALARGARGTGFV